MINIKCATTPDQQGKSMARTIKLYGVSEDGGLYIATHRGVQLGVGLASDAVRHQTGRHG